MCRTHICGYGKVREGGRERGREGGRERGKREGKEAGRGERDIHAHVTELQCRLLQDWF